MLIFILTTGLREGEACALKWSDIDENGKIIHICRDARQAQVVDSSGNKTGNQVTIVQTTKTASGTRTISMTQQTQSIIQRQKILQNNEKAEAGILWNDGNYIFASKVGTI